MSELEVTGELSPANVGRLNRLSLTIEDQLTGLRLDQQESKSQMVSGRGSQLSSTQAESVTLVSGLAVNEIWQLKQVKRSRQ